MVNTITTAVKPGSKGVSGWLIVFILVCCLSSLSMFGAAGNLAYEWQTAVKKGAHIPEAFERVAVVEIATSLALCVAFAAIVVLTVAKSRFMPGFAKGVMAATVAYTLFDVISAQ